MQSELNSRLDALCQISQRKLAEILCQIPGTKDLIIDPVLMKPLERITGVSFLRFHGIDKLFKLDKTVRCANSERVYLIQADLITAKHVCDQINYERRNEGTNSYNLILVPCELVTIRHLLEEEGISGLVSIYSFSWELLQLDTCLLSLELNSLPQTLFVDGDRSFLPAVARSLWSLQLLLGRIPCILTQGRYSGQLPGMMKVLMDQLGAPGKANCTVGCLLLVDRDVDYASVLLTPVTYTALLDEVFGVSGGSIQLDDRVTGDKGTINYQLGGTDSIYHHIKNRHFSDVFSFLSAESKRLQSEYERSKRLALPEMKRYVTTELQRVMAAKRALAYHIGACEVVIGELGQRFENLHCVERSMLEGTGRRDSLSFVEHCVASSGLPALRLLALMSLTRDGLTQEDATSLQTQFLHAQGFQHLLTLRNLEKLGLLRVSSESSTLAERVAQAVSTKHGLFRATATKLGLFPTQDDCELKNPSNMSYVFGGAYIPAVCQLVNLLIKGENPPEELVKWLPSPATWQGKWSDPTPRTFLVCFVGGVTYAEVAAFQLLEKLTGVRILVAGTSIINGNTLIQSTLASPLTIPNC